MSAATDFALAPLLQTERVVKTFRGLVALQDHAISIFPREIVGVIGPNGSGKSTLFNVITGFSAQDSGTVTFDGATISGRSATEIAQRGIARTFQASRLFRSMTVVENVAAGAALRHPINLLDALLRGGRYRRLARAVADTVAEMLDLVGLGEQADRAAASMPYGDQRRLEIARALATRPRVLLLDEPAAGLDATETRSLLMLIRSIRERYGIAIVVVEHDMDLIMNLCERIQVLAAGRVICEGTPSVVQADLAVREAYLGHA